MIEQLPAILAAGHLQPDLRELRDALWLSTYIAVTPRTDQTAQPPTETARAEPSSEAPVPTPQETARAEPSSEEPVPTPRSDIKAGLYAAGPANESHHYIRAMRVLDPAVPAGRNQLQLSRSLRPLRRRTPSRTSFVIDEAATAAYAAEEGIWLPVLCPDRGRWLDLTLIADSSPSMTLWQQTIAELQTLMERLGAFRVVRLAAVDGSTSPSKSLTVGVGTIKGKHARQNREPGTLIDSTRRQAILIVTDAVGSAWRDGRMHTMLRRFGASMPVAIAMVIPQRMWAGVGLRAVPAELHVQVPGAANGMLRTRGTPVTYAQAVHVPIMELSSRWLAPWADVVAGAPGWRRSALLAAPPDGAAPVSGIQTAGSAVDVVRRFRSAASPTAFRLACYLSATLLNLPMMRLVQRIMLPESNTSHLAEVFLGGLLSEAPRRTEIVQYDFLPGVRDGLSRYLLRDEMLDVLRETSQFAAMRFGQQLDFAALLSDPEGTPLPVEASAEGEPLAYIAASMLAKLGGRYRVLADRLAATSPAALGNVTFSPATAKVAESPATGQAEPEPSDADPAAAGQHPTHDEPPVPGVRAEPSGDRDIDETQTAQPQAIDPGYADEGRRLAQRLRELREREYGPLTQRQLARALGGSEPLSIATVSLWEKPASGRLPPPQRLAAYARLFCTSRSFASGTPRLLRDDELTEEEQARETDLYNELLALRDRARATAVDSPLTRERPSYPPANEGRIVAGIDSPSIPARRLAERLRDLREREYKQLSQMPSPLTQKQLAKVLGGAEALSIATVSLWEKPGSNRLPPPQRLAAYARLFCTSRSFETGSPRLLRSDELTEQEQEREAELYAELLVLRERAQSTGPASVAREQPALARRSSIWRFPDQGAVTIVCSNEPNPPSIAHPGHLNYTRFAGYAYIDALIEVFGQVKADNPDAFVRVLPTEQLASDFTLNNMVIIGGEAVSVMLPSWALDIPLPRTKLIPGTNTHVFTCSVGDEIREFASVIDDEALVEDVGLIVRGPHPLVPERTVTMLDGITSRGVHGAALCFTDAYAKDGNEQYLQDTFGNTEAFCVLMRVPVRNSYALPPILWNDDMLLYKWSNETGTRW